MVLLRKDDVSSTRDLKVTGGGQFKAVVRGGEGGREVKRREGEGKEGEEGGKQKRGKRRGMREVKGRKGRGRREVKVRRAEGEKRGRRYIGVNA